MAESQGERLSDGPNPLLIDAWTRGRSGDEDDVGLGAGPGRTQTVTRNMGAAFLLWTVLVSPHARAELPYYTGQVLPAPREVLTEWRSLPLKEDGVQVRLGESMGGAGRLAEELLQQRLTETVAAQRPTEESGKGQARSIRDKSAPITIHLGTFGDGIIKEVDSAHGLAFDSLVLPKFGYALRVRETNDGAADIAAAGVDARGAFYAAVTLLQQMGVENGKPVLKCADINDWPEWQRPYAMEYGPATRQQLIDLAMYKVGHFAIQHRLEWREFRPDHMYGKRPLEEFLSEMAAFRDETGLFDYMLLLHIYASPSPDYELLDITNEDHIAEVIARCQYAASKGFTHIMILADDWTPRDKGRYVCMHESERKRFGDSVGRAHGYLMARLYDALKREYPALDFSICPAPYSLGHVYTGEGERKPHMVQYLRDLDAEMPPNIAVVWTGRFVGSPSIERAHFLEYSGLVGNRPTFLWDNSNCCDEAPSPQRFVTTRYDGFAADSHGIFYLNAFALHWPWQRPFVLSAMDALWNPEAFKVDGSFEQAVDKAYGPGVYPLVEAYRRTRAAMNGVQNDPQRLRTLVEEADAQLKAIEERGLPTKRLRDDWARQKALVDLKVAEGIVRRFTEPPVLDGKLDEPAWVNADVLSGFTPYGAAEHLDQTELRLGYDNQYFYAAFTCHHQGGLPTPTIRGRHDGNVFGESDAVGMMLQPQGGTYGHFVVDHVGNVFDERNSGGLDWDPQWKAAIHVEEKVWTVEIAVPLSELESFPMDEWPKSGTKWRANFHRYYAAKNQTSAWSDTHGNRFHVTEFFGVLTFE